MGRNISRRWTVVLLVGLGSLAVRAAENDDAPPSAEQIARWIQQLDDQSFAVRNSASKSLLQSGTVVTEAVAAAAAGKSLEVTARTVRILEELASAAENATAKAAKKALVDLAASNHPAAAVRARRALRTHQQRIIAILERSGARVQVIEDRVVAVDFDAAVALGESLRLLHELPDLEDLSFATPLMNDDGMAALQGLPRLWNLNLFQSRVGDVGLKYLKTLPSLRRVPMGKTQVTDQGLVHLKDLTQLEYIGLRADRVTDAGLVHLKNLTNLTGLHLGETQVTDAGLEHLKSLTGLQYVELWNTAVTEAGMAKLIEALPQLQIRMIPR